VLYDPSEIILICGFAAQEAFLIIKIENSCCLIFGGHRDVLDLIEIAKKQH